jgi:hypothetical protein
MKIEIRLRAGGPSPHLALQAVAIDAECHDCHPKVSEKTKKPGETGENLSKSSDAYKDCISKSAHDGKTPGAKAHTKPKT